MGRRGRQRAAGIDTSAVLRAGMVAFVERAVLYDVFHGDLHAGNLLVQPGGRVALLDYGITGRLDPPGRRAFMRLVVGATVSDIRMQLEALRDLGALPPADDADPPRPAAAPGDHHAAHGRAPRSVLAILSVTGVPAVGPPLGHPLDQRYLA